MPDLLEEATSTLNEILRIHKLNQELLEVLSVTAQWVSDYAEKNNIPFPNSSTYYSLINKAETLLEEMTSSYPDYYKVSRRKVTPLIKRREQTKTYQYLPRLYIRGV